MTIKTLSIGNITASVPIIQGGMAVRISTARLAAAVANQGGIGIIAGTGMSTGELREEIRLARSISSGTIGVNVLFAVSNFAELVKSAIDEGIDLLVSGVGISRDMYAWGRRPVLLLCWPYPAREWRSWLLKCRGTFGDRVPAL